MKTKPDNETIELRGRVAVEMFERIKESLREISTPQERLAQADRMVATLRLAIQSLENEADDPKIARQIRTLQKEIRDWEKQKLEIENRLD